MNGYYYPESLSRTSDVSSTKIIDFDHAKRIIKSIKGRIKVINLPD